MTQRKINGPAFPLERELGGLLTIDFQQRRVDSRDGKDAGHRLWPTH